jgi:L-aminopeptidase/D-esterase-like protein
MTTFTIANLERQADTGLVTTIHWTATKQDGDAVASTYASMAVEAGDNFVPFEQLTEQAVIDWVKAKLDLESLEASLDAQIAEQKTPKVLSGLPWSPAETE